MLPPRSVLAKIFNKNHWSILLGTSAFTFGLVILFLKSWLIEIITASVIVLRPNTLLENLWRKTPVEVPTSAYFFNWTNPEAIHDFGVKPKFEEVGPYVFNQRLEKTKVVWNDNNDTVSYVQLRTFSYDNKIPNGDLSDRITSLNVVTMAGSHYIENWNYFLKRAASMFLSTVYPRVDITRTANQLLLEGYDDIIVDIANYLPFIASEIPRFNKFGWLFILNGTDHFEGIINMETGQHGTFNVRKWDYNDSISLFQGPCSKLHGSAGELYDHKISPDHINVFVPQLCRVLKFQYEEDVWVDGILGYKYIIGDAFLDNGTIHEENKCFCSGHCIPSGVFNLSSCRYGLPAYGSLPNFYTADPFYASKIEGMKPDKEKHESYIVLEPNTGLPLSVALRLQLNILLHPVKGITVFQDVPELYFPLFWMEVKVKIPHIYQVLLKVYLAGPYIILGVSIGLMLLGLYWLLFVSYKTSLISFYKQIHMQKRSASVCPEEVPLQNDVEATYISNNEEWKEPVLGTFKMR